MLWGAEEIKETIRMIESEHLDIRTITMGISLLDCPSKEINSICEFIERKVELCASNLNNVTKEIEELFGVPIVNKRIALTPVSLIAEGVGEEDYLKIAKTMDRVAESINIDYIAGFSALVQKGATQGDIKLINSIPSVMELTKRVCSSVNLASTKAGINMEIVWLMGHIIKEVAERTKEEGGIGCAKLVVFCNAPEDNPFIAGAFHGVGEPECVINVGVSGPGVVLSAIERLKKMEPHFDFFTLSETIKRMAFKITRAGEIIGREVVRRLGPPVQFGIVDLSLAPTPAIGDSVANILEAMGLEKAGSHGSTAALALVVDCVKKGGVMATSSVGGLSGAFIPVSEDAGMVEAVRCGAMSLEKLEAMTSVCSVGLDMVAIPGKTPPETISAIIADEMAIGMINNKTTGVRIIPVPGKDVGESVNLGGLLGELIVMEVKNFDSSRFIKLKGRIPPPLVGINN